MFFSLLAVFIIIGLYVLFLGDMVTQGLGDLPSARFLMDSWIMSGLLAVTPITTALGAMGTIIEDKKLLIFQDFAVAPISRNKVYAAYLASGLLVSLSLTILTFILAEGYILAYGGELLDAAAAGKTLLLILFATLTASVVMFYLVSWFKSSNAYSAASMITGTMIGFLTGIYIPIGVLPKAVQVAIKLFPPAHAAVLMRKVMLARPEQLAFAAAPAKALAAFRLELGIDFQLGDRLLTSLESVIYLALILLVFLILSLIRFRKKEK